MKNQLKNKTKTLKIYHTAVYRKRITQPAMNRLYIMLSNPFRKRVGNGRTHYSSMSLYPDSQTYYKLIVEIRNRSTYPYQNINLSVCYDSPELKKLQTDTLTAVLADKEGIWKGDGWGGYISLHFPQETSI